MSLIVTTAEAIPVLDLLARAERKLDLGDFVAAARDFELLLGAKHDAALEGRIRLGYAWALEGTGELERAAAELERLVALASEAERDQARIEWLGRLLLLERFAEASDVALAVSLDSASRQDQMLLRAALALGSVAAGEAARAQALLAPAWVALDADDERRPRSVRLSAAWVSFAAAEVEALAARRIVFDPVPVEVALALEARCRPMVAAQSAYAEAMRLESGRLRLLAGERIARLYLELHRDILAAPLPAGFVEPGQRALAEAALLLRYEVLLEKAEQMLRITLEGTPDTQAARPLRVRVEAALADVVHQRAANDAEVDGLPVLRGDLVRILESLGAAPTVAPAQTEEHR